MTFNAHIEQGDQFYILTLKNTADTTFFNKYQLIWKLEYTDN